MKRAKVEARGCWYLLDDAGNACWRSLITAKERAKRIRNGSNYAFMVPADPAREAVVRAAVAYFAPTRLYGAERESHDAGRRGDLQRAVEKLQKERKR